MNEQEMTSEELDKLAKWIRALLKENLVEWRLREVDEVFALARQGLQLGEENYTDLLDQMDEAWGVTGSVNLAEIRAFIESRMVHKPTASLREKIATLPSAFLREALEPVTKTVTFAITGDPETDMIAGILRVLDAATADSNMLRTQQRICEYLAHRFKDRAEANERSMARMEAIQFPKSIGANPIANAPGTWDWPTAGNTSPLFTASQQAEFEKEMRRTQERQDAIRAAVEAMRTGKTESEKIREEALAEQKRQFFKELANQSGTQSLPSQCPDSVGGSS